MAHQPEPGDGLHDFTKHPTFHPVGITYLILASLYTIFLVVCLTTAWVKYRDLAAIHIRGLVINSIAILAIHGYVVALFVVYPLNSWFKCGSEFWIMNTVLPSGMALYQICNARLRSYAQMQQSMTELECYSKTKDRFAVSLSGLRKRFTSWDVLPKTYIYVSLGMVTQISLAFLLFFGSRRFSPTTGVFGTHVGPMACRRGFEWIPSIFWQFFWVWAYGPWTLYKTRGIKDTHYWALQTKITVLAGLPGTLMWLGFLYGATPSTDKINEWWPPAMWFAPGLITMQISTILFCFLDARAQLRREKEVTMNAIASASSLTSSECSTSSLISMGKELANSWTAFEYVLQHYTAELLNFSAKRDFSSENVLFLQRVRLFKSKWCNEDNMPSTKRVEMYEAAARIYFELVDRETSKLHINIDSKSFEMLKKWFQSCEYLAPTSSSLEKDVKSGSGSSRAAVAPWEIPNLPAASQSVESLPPIPAIYLQSPSHTDIRYSTCYTDYTPLCNESSEHLLQVPSSSKRRARRNAHITATPTDPDSATDTTPKLLFDPHPGTVLRKKSIRRRKTTHLIRQNYVPSRFTAHVFDKTEESIKALAYTNTWKTFIKSLSLSELENLYNRLHSAPIGPFIAEEESVNIFDMIFMEGEDDIVMEYEMGPMPPLSNADASSSTSVSVAVADTTMPSGTPNTFDYEKGLSSHPPTPRLPSSPHRPLHTRYDPHAPTSTFTPTQTPNTYDCEKGLSSHPSTAPPPSSPHRRHLTQYNPHVFTSTPTLTSATASANTDPNAIELVYLRPDVYKKPVKSKKGKERMV